MIAGWRGRWSVRVLVMYARRRWKRTELKQDRVVRVGPCPEHEVGRSRHITCCQTLKPAPGQSSRCSCRCSQTPTVLSPCWPPHRPVTGQRLHDLAGGSAARWVDPRADGGVLTLDVNVGRCGAAHQALPPRSAMTARTCHAT